MLPLVIKIFLNTILNNIMYVSKYYFSKLQYFYLNFSQTFKKKKCLNLLLRLFL